MMVESMDPEKKELPGPFARQRTTYTGENRTML